MDVVRFVKLPVKDVSQVLLLECAFLVSEDTCFGEPVDERVRALV